MKKGFTLSELLGVIIILGAVLLITISIVEKFIIDNKNEMFNSQLKNIELALENWASEYQKPNNGETITLSFSQLKEAGMIDINLINPITQLPFPNDMILKIINNNNIISYDIITSGTNVSDYNSITSIKVNGNVLDYVEVGSSNYNDLGVTAKDTTNNIITDVTKTIEPNLNLNKKGLYLVTYKTVDNVAYRTIVVRDTIGPEIKFSNNLEMTYEQSKTYNFKSDITVTDNSNEEVTVTVETNIKPLKGNYTVKYIAKDTSGNETIKLRKVTIKE